MLPSIRLIAVTFLCGFAVVFAGLRIAASLNDIHQALPVVVAAQAAPLAPTPIADRQTTDSHPAAPALYDLRFVVSNTAFTPTLASLTVPAAPPLDITPPAIEKVAKEELPAPPGATTAKANDEPPIAIAAPEAPAPVPPAPEAAPQISPDAPADTPPEAAPDKQSTADSITQIASLTSTENARAPAESVAAPAIETTAIGTGAAQEGKSALAMAIIEPEPSPAPQVAASPAEAPQPEQAADVASTDQPSAPAVQVTLPMPHARPGQTSTAHPAPRKPAHAAHKKRVRVVQRAPAPATTSTFSSFGGFGSPSTQPFGTTR